MMTLFFTFFMIVIFGKLGFLALKAAWGFTKVLFVFICLPIILIGFLLAGVAYLAVPILAVLGIFALVKSFTGNNTVNY